MRIVTKAGNVVDMPNITRVQDLPKLELSDVEPVGKCIILGGGQSVTLIPLNSIDALVWGKDDEE